MYKRTCAVLAPAAVAVLSVEHAARTLGVERAAVVEEAVLGEVATLREHGPLLNAGYKNRHAKELQESCTSFRKRIVTQNKCVSRTQERRSSRTQERSFQDTRELQEELRLL